MALSEQLLEILVCPSSKAPLIYFEEEGFLFCAKSKLKYRIEDGIPNMLAEDAESVDDDGCRKLLADAKARGLANADS